MGQNWTPLQNSNALSPNPEPR